MKHSHWKMKRTIGAAFICLLILISPAQATILHVSQYVNGGDGSGVDWANAKASLRVALSMADPGDTILVGQGTYHPASGQSFVIDQTLDQIKLIGGYAGWLPNGTLAPDPFQRDVQANRTILTGDFLGDDDPFINDLDYLRNAKLIDNSDTVVWVQDVTPGTRIEGFFIERGAMNSPTGTLRGGGMFIIDSAMDVVNCTFRFNVAGIPFELPEDPFNDQGTTSDGGGAAVLGGHIIVDEVQYTRFINCTFHDNIAGRGGALALVDGSLIPTQVKVVNSLFYNNQALVISNLVLVPPDGSGGAISVVGVADSQNPDHDHDVKIEITNCTIANNNAENTTGGLRVVDVDEDFVTLVQNSVFWGNDEKFVPSTASEITRSGGGTTPSKISVKYSDIQGNLGSQFLIVDDSISADPDFAFADKGIFRVPINSPVVEAGDPDTLANQLIPVDEFDLDGNGNITEPTPDLDLFIRVFDSDLAGGALVEMGAYEVFPSCCADVANFDHVVNVSDLLALLGAWGDCPDPCDSGVIISPDTCRADIDRNCDVDVTDLMVLLDAWGTCTSICFPLGSPTLDPSITSTQFPSLAAYGGQYGPVSDKWTSTSQTGLRLAADEFEPVDSASVTNVNWWGFYEQSGANCVGGYGDSFTVKYYNAALHSGTGQLVPGSIIASFPGVSVFFRKDTGQTVGNGIPLYFYTANHAAVFVTADTPYFVEIRNTGGDTSGSSGCHWRWAWSIDGTLLYSARKPEGYSSYLSTANPENTMNLAYGLDIEIQQMELIPPPPPPPPPPPGDDDDDPPGGGGFGRGG